MGLRGLVGGHVHKSFLALAPAVLTALGGGCGDIDAADDPYAGTIVYEAPARGYHFNYLSPPWFILRASGNTAEFVVAEGFAATPESIRYHLRAEPYAGAPEEVASEQAALRNVSSRTILDRHGVRSGREFEWRDAMTGIHTREAYFPGYRMVFTSPRSMVGDPIIAAMVASFEAGPAPPSKGGGL